MQELEKLKSVLLDLNKNQQEFSVRLSEFEALQAQVSALEKRAQVDPEAGQKVKSVNAYMAQEGHHTQRQIMTYVGAFESHLLKARETLAGLAGSGPESLALLSPPSPAHLAQKHRRSFA